MSLRVLISCPHLQKTIHHYTDLFAGHGIEIELPPMIQQLTEPELLEMIDRFDGVIAGDDHFTSKVLGKGVRLKVIAKWGIGLDAIDLEAAKKRGIKIFNTPDVFADEVADVVMGYLILLSRRLHKLNESVRNGGWLQIQGRSLKGRSLGIIGMGSIGKAVVSRAKVSGMEIAGYDIKEISADFIEKTGLRPVRLDDLVRTSDFISLNCNLTKDNYHLLGVREFDMMKEGVSIVNTSRGPLIDETALLNSLTSGKVAGAALDVFEKEPLPADSPLRKFENCIFGTHNGSNTLEAVMRVNQMAIQNLFKGLGISNI
jgi:D-3-phosphoglycerate dehydrogenase